MGIFATPPRCARPRRVGASSPSIPNSSTWEKFADAPPDERELPQPRRRFARLTRGKELTMATREPSSKKDAASTASSEIGSGRRRRKHGYRGYPNGRSTGGDIHWGSG